MPLFGDIVEAAELGHGRSYKLLSNMRYPAYLELLESALRHYKAGALSTAALRHVASNKARDIDVPHSFTKGLEATSTVDILSPCEDLVFLAVKAGANPNQNIRSIDSSTFTPLCLAARSGRVDAARELLAVGARPCAEALREAVIHQKRDVVQLLLDNGADPNVLPCWGACALGIAIEGKDFEIVHQLLLAGADPSLVDPMQLSYAPLEKIIRFLQVSGYSLSAERPEKNSLLYSVARRVYYDVTRQQAIARAETTLGISYVDLEETSPEEIAAWRAAMSLVVLAHPAVARWRAKLDALMKLPVNRRDACEFADLLDQDYPL